MIISVPVFDKITVRKFQGIDEKELQFSSPLSSLLFNPCSGKSSFLNSLVFLYTGDIRNFDNYNYVYNIKYSDIPGIIFNNTVKSLGDLLVQNDYLSLTCTSDVSMLSSIDRSIVDDYVVRFIFKRVVDTENMKKYSVESTILLETDYSYLCYDENKFCYETRFRDILNYFTDNSEKISIEELYSRIRNIVSDVFNLDVFFSGDGTFTVSKDGRVIHTPCSTLSTLISIISLLLQPTNNIIFVNDFITKFDNERKSKIISTLTELLYSTSFNKKIVFVGNNTEYDTWSKLLSSDSILLF